jgi:hypothetical protein
LRKKEGRFFMTIESLMGWDWFKWLLVGMGLTFLLLWVGIRSRSWHVLFELIWRLLHGRHQPDGRILWAFHMQQTALMHFRWITGIRKVRTTKQAKALAAWCLENDEEVADVRACRHYFDVEQPGVNLTDKSLLVYLQSKDENRPWLPGQGMRGVIFVVLLLLVVGMSFTVVGMLIPGAMVQFKEGTEAWIVMYPDQVALLRSPEMGFAATDCARDESAIAQRTKLLIDEVQVMCEWLGEPEAKRSKYIDRSLKGQRWAFVMLNFLVLWLLISLWRFSVAISAVEAMRRRLDERNAGSKAVSESSVAAQLSMSG